MLIVGATTSVDNYNFFPVSLTMKSSVESVQLTLHPYTPLVIFSAVKLSRVFCTTLLEFVWFKLPFSINAHDFIGNESETL